MPRRRRFTSTHDRKEESIKTLNFEAVTLNRWQRAVGEPLQDETRPHVVALNPEAEQFLREQPSVYGPLYVGCGFAEVNGRMVPAFRFKFGTDMPYALKLAEGAFQAELSFQEDMACRGRVCGVS